MKKNILRKGNILLLIALLFVPIFVKAAEGTEACITHKNYYLYLLPKTVPEFVNEVYQSSGNITEVYTGAYFPVLPSDAEAPKGNTGIIRGRICLSKDGKEDGSSIQCSYGTWTLEDYYRMMIIVSNQNERIRFKDENDTTWKTGLYEKDAGKDQNGNKVIEHYFGGSQWFICNDENCSNPILNDAGTDVSSMGISELVKGSYLPSQTIITFNPEDSSKATIKRRINVKDFLDYIEYDNDENPKDDGNGNIVINEESREVVPFPNPKANETGTILLAPAAYYVEYQTCGEYYTATINYYYYQNGKTTEDRVEFDNDEDNPYVKDYLSAGDSITKASPDLEGCVIVNTKGEKYDKDKTVTLTIDEEDPKDVTKNVYYYCKALDEGKPNSTGDALIYIAWIIGLGAIVYSVHYFKKAKEEALD